ncbi:hypothetical protein CTEN210_03969 [Chaetoceros tenuissimus]|uniref:C6H2-type domain-containing protein n=1 Tax=Chaetoceros tenuissimus TaxID=426638 RepID=A0AAD3H2H9_9STRA|nr:hypothetical protein CTEN210_03969 [Chaetoceros tenuissimus]
MEVVIGTSCKGCGKVQDGTNKFKACPICIELKMLPSMYCCEECFRADWKSHKKKHEEFSNSKTAYLESLQLKPGFERAATKQYRQDLKRASEAEKLTYEYARNSISSAMAALDYNKAEILCRKAIIRFPTNPEPYYQMAQILFRQDEVVNAMGFLHLSMEKTCRILLTAQTTKPSSMDEFYLSHYVQRGQFLNTMYMSFHYMRKDWIFNVKGVMSLWSYYFEIIKDKNSFDRDVNLLDPETVTSLLESMRNEPTNQISCNRSSSPYFDGEWVIAHGLTSAIGKTLNHRVAMVKGDDLNEEGRVAVVFKEGGPIKYLKVENLKHARTVNAKAALLMHLEEPAQWRFMMNDFFEA